MKLDTKHPNIWADLFVYQHLNATLNSTRMFNHSDNLQLAARECIFEVSCMEAKNIDYL